MTKKVESPKWNYGIIADTLVEVNDLAAQLKKVMLSDIPLNQKKELLQNRVSTYEMKVVEIKNELAGLLADIRVNDDTRNWLIETINNKLKKISIDPNSFWEKVHLEVEEKWTQNFDLTQFDVTVPLDEQEENELINDVISEFNTVTFPAELHKKKLQENIEKKVAGRTYKYRNTSHDHNYYVWDDNDYVGLYKHHPLSGSDTYYLHRVWYFIWEGSQDSITALSDVYKNIDKFAINGVEYYKVRGQNWKWALMDCSYKFITWFVYGQIRAKGNMVKVQTLPVVIKNTNYTKYRKKLEGINDLTNHWSEWFDIDFNGKIVRNRPSTKKDKIPEYLNKLQTVTDEEKIEEFLDMPFEAFHARDLPVRAYNALKAARITNFRQLLEWDYPVRELMKYRNTGQKTINGIKALLAKYGLADKRKKE